MSLNRPLTSEELDEIYLKPFAELWRAACERVYLEYLEKALRDLPAKD